MIHFINSRSPRPRRRRSRPTAAFGSRTASWAFICGLTAFLIAAAMWVVVALSVFVDGAIPIRPLVPILGTASSFITLACLVWLEDGHG